MRVSTVMMFERSVGAMNRQQGEFMKVGEQLASGKRVVRPSDDPQAASRAVGISQSLATSAQHNDSRVSARNALSQEESVLNSVGDAVIRAKSLMVQAGNGTQSNADRESIAAEMRGVYEALIGQANSTDGNGNHIFAGYRDGTAPFVKGAEGAISYVGSDEVRQQKVDASRLMQAGDSGRDVFQSVAAGAGYLARSDADNAGTLTFTGPQVSDVTANDYGDRFSITFSSPTSYSVIDTTSGDTLVEDASFSSGDTLTFGGLNITLEGEPEAGDSIALGQARDMDPNLFAALESAISALETPIESDVDRARFSNTMGSASREMDNALDNVLTVRASVGSRLNELDTLDVVGADRELAYTQAKSDLIDLDYNAAISEYALRQVGLQAAQKAFVDLQGTSLFEMI